MKPAVKFSKQAVESKLQVPLLFNWTLLLLLILTPLSSSALYLHETENSYFNLTALGRVYALYHDNPEGTLLYSDSTTSGLAGIARLIGQGETAHGLRYDFNLYQTAIPQKMAAAASSVTSIERSDLFEWSFHDSDYQHLTIDQFYFSWSSEKTSLRIGRQPINLASNYYFTPNDLFAPFSAQTFYRTYKAGVDGLRIDHSLGEFSQLSFISVLGYQTDPASDSGWSNGIEATRGSHLIRYTASRYGLEWSLFSGQLKGEIITGGGFQGELTNYIGMRSEIQHYQQSGQTQSYIKAAFGLDRRWDNTIHLRGEAFYNGTGHDQVSEYVAGNTYLAVRYFSAGLSYEFTPLFNGDLLLLKNIDDHSSLIALNGLYSLGDESEVNFGLSMPFGKEPTLSSIQSEFGTAPVAISLEIRSYF